MSNSTSTASSFKWNALLIELQLLVLEQLSYRELKVMQQVSKDMQSLTTSTSKLRSSLFLTEKVDLIALYNLVGLPQWADATAAKIEARNKGKKDEEENWKFNCSESDEDIEDDDGDYWEAATRSDNVKENVIKLHPLLHTLRVYKSPDGGFELRVPGDASKAMQDNASSPPLGRVTVSTLYNFGHRGMGSGRSTRVGRPQHKSDTPVTVQQVIAALHKLIKQENGFFKGLSARLPKHAVLIPGAATIALSVNDQGIFKIELEY